MKISPIEQLHPDRDPSRRILGALCGQVIAGLRDTAYACGYSDADITAAIHAAADQES